LKKATKLQDFSLGFGFADYGSILLQAINNSLHFVSLQRLELFHLAAEKKDVVGILNSVKDTLEVLALEYITIEDYWSIATFLRDQLNLKYIKLRKLNIDDEGLYFRKVNQQRPETSDVSIIGDDN
jgi:hypothetical protein